MKRIILLLLLLVCCSRLMAGPISKIVFFGDSLSDNGNLYKLLLKYVPKSPPYYQGRFSNGPTWAEHVGKYFYEKYYIDYEIYALGGATAISHLPTSKFVSPTTLRLEVDQYLLADLFKDKSQVLFAIWIGGNDYLFDRMTDVDTVVNRISWAMTTLIDEGAKHFLVLNLPDLSRLPRSANDPQSGKLHELTVEHNQQLSEKIKSLSRAYPDVTIHYIDIYRTFNDVMVNPKKYNDQYHVNITNTTQGCWTGGYQLKNVFNEQTMANDLRQRFNAAGVDVKKLNIKQMTNYIQSSPSLSEAYLVGSLHGKGVLPCTNVNEYLFWDEIHPTALVHEILAKIIIEQMGAHITA